MTFLTDGGSPTTPPPPIVLSSDSCSPTSKPVDYRAAGSREASPVNRHWTNVLPREGLVVVVEMFTDDTEYFRVVAVTTLTRNPDA
jgi:hypothetical protein